MISRRLLMGVGAAAALTQTPKPAAAQTDLSLETLRDLSPDQSPVFVSDQGWFDIGPPDEALDGITRIAGPDGAHWVRRDFHGTLRPHWFARPGDGSDDALMVQRACDHAIQYGPVKIDLGNGRYQCESRLIFDPTHVILTGSDAILDFTNRAEPASSDPELTLSQLQLTDGWDIRDGSLFADETAQPLNSYLTLQDEGRYRFEIDVASLAGSADFPSLTVTVANAQRETITTSLIIAPGKYCFEIDGPETSARLSFTADANVQIDRVSVTSQGWRECILVRAGVESTQYGHKWMDGIEIVGPGQDTKLHGIRFDTKEQAKSSRLSLRQVTVRGFETGLVFADRAYLINGTEVRIACKTGIHFLNASKDAGELITFSDTVFDGGSVALRNGGGEFMLTNCAIDFVDRIYVGAGELTLQGCHLEVNRPKAADTPLFDLSVGTIAILGGSFGVTGANFEAGNQCDHIFELRSQAATATMNDVTVYNLRSQSNALAGGEGWLDVTRVRGRRPRHMAPITQYKPTRNLLGALPFDLRTSSTADGPFERYPTQETSFKVSNAFRNVWLFGIAPVELELGVTFDVWSEQEGDIFAMLQAFNGGRRVQISDRWHLKVGEDRLRFGAHTGDTHPSVAGNGRMPTGFSEFALFLDLSALEGSVEISSPFVCAT